MNRNVYSRSVSPGVHRSNRKAVSDQKKKAQRTSLTRSHPMHLFSVFSGWKNFLPLLKTVFKENSFEQWMKIFWRTEVWIPFFFLVPCRIKCSLNLHSLHPLDFGDRRCCWFSEIAVKDLMGIRPFCFETLRCRLWPSLPVLCLVVDRSSISLLGKKCYLINSFFNFCAACCCVEIEVRSFRVNSFRLRLFWMHPCLIFALPHVSAPLRLHLFFQTRRMSPNVLLSDSRKCDAPRMFVLSGLIL